MAEPTPAPAFQIATSRHFAAFLAAQRTSLAFSTYQTGKLFLIGLKPTGELSVFERTFNRCMGCGRTRRRCGCRPPGSSGAARTRSLPARSRTGSTASTSRGRDTRPGTSTRTT